MSDKIPGANNLKIEILIGVDFGGTKILTGAMTEKGQVLCDPVKVPTNGREDADDIIKRLTDSIDAVIQKIGTSVDGIGGIGLGVTGPLDIKNGIILECPQLPTLHHFPLKTTVEKYFGRPVFMNNDANCLIYGETLFGSGVGKNNVVGFTLGTGLGCATILDKKIFAGSTESAGEIWLSPYEDGTIEELVCGAGVSKIYKKISGEEKSALEIASLAEKGDGNALSTWQEFGRHLSVAIAWTINVIDPEIVILGGSISNAFKFFAPSMEANLRKHICPTPAEKTKVVCARLGSNAGFIGAASLAIRRV
jgi:glucokinase